MTGSTPGRGCARLTLLLAAGLVALCASPVTGQQRCPTWEEMLETGAAVQLDAMLEGEHEERLSLVYLNSPVLGRCALGPVLFADVNDGLLQVPGVQAFWVGVSGRSADRFTPEKLWLVQSGKEIPLGLKGEVDSPTAMSTVGRFESEHLLLFLDEIDPAVPMRFIYVSAVKPVDVEYRLPEAYR